MKKTISINNRLIGENYPPYIIAEAAISHQGDFNTAKEMVIKARAAGCDAIKFQMHILNNEMLKNVKTSKNFDKPLFQTLKETELSLSNHIELMKLCKKIGIEYMCTPFSKDASDILDKKLKVNVFKIGSGELTNIPLLVHIAKKNKPMIISTGMSKLSEIKFSLNEVMKFNKNILITHCVSAYPTPYEIVNLDLITKYKKLFKLPVGLSDHSIGIYTSLGAVALGANLIEKHFTLNKLQSGPDHPVSLEPPELEQLVKGCNACFLAKGSQKKIHDSEKEIMIWARESVVSEKKIRKNQIIKQDMVWVKRPAPAKDGIQPKDLKKVIGMKAIKDIPKDTQICWKDLKKV